MAERDERPPAVSGGPRAQRVDFPGSARAAAEQTRTSGGPGYRARWRKLRRRDHLPTLTHPFSPVTVTV